MVVSLPKELIGLYFLAVLYTSVGTRKMGTKVGWLAAVVIILLLILIFYPLDGITEEFGRGGGGHGGGMGHGGMRHGGGGIGRTGGIWRGGHRGPAYGYYRSWSPYTYGDHDYDDSDYGYGDVNSYYYANPTDVIDSVVQQAENPSGKITVTQLWSNGGWTRSFGEALQDRGQISSERAASILSQVDSNPGGEMSFVNDGMHYRATVYYNSGGTSVKSSGNGFLPSDISGGR